MNKIMDVLCIYVDLDLSDQDDVDLDVGNRKLVEEWCRRWAILVMGGSSIQSKSV